MTVRVYFAEQARYAIVIWNETTANRLRQLKKDGDTYLASTADDLRALRPHEVRS